MKYRSARLFLIVFLLLGHGCHRPGRLRVSPITHVAVGRSATFVAYEEQSPTAIGPERNVATSAAIHPVAASWSVSDSSIASVASDGTLTGLKTGHVEISATWQKQRTVTPVEVVSKLSVDSLTFASGSVAVGQAGGPGLIEKNW